MTTTRRRGAELEAAILDAGWRLLVDGGYEAFTFEGVAERARTGKPVLYRRWPTKQALLFAVLDHRVRAIEAPVPDTGSLREDVLTLMRSVNRGSDGPPLLLGLAVGTRYFDQTDTSPAELYDALLGGRRAAMETILRRAADRGEIPAEPLPDRVVTIPLDLLRNELIMTRRHPDDAALVDIVDTVFLPLVGARVDGGRGNGRHGRHGGERCRESAG